MYRYNLLLANRRRLRLRRTPIIDLRRCTYQQPITKAFIEQLGEQNYLRIENQACHSCNHIMQLER